MKEIKRIIKPCYWIMFLVLACAERPAEDTKAYSVYDSLEFQMSKIVEPTFPDYSISIVDFGAIGDGQKLNTKAFADAIHDVAGKGGGRVIVPRGIWLTGPIILESNINIFTEEGALVIFSTDKDLYPLVETSFEGLNTVRCMSPVYGKNLENIAFTGKGVFDGSGEAWRMVKKSKLTSSQWSKLVASGGILNEKKDTWFPSESFKKGAELSDMNVPRNFSSMDQYKAIKDFLRPVMVSLVNCKNVLLDGPVFQNSPAWCIHPLMCENLTIRNINVRNPWFSQNGDGIDIESCKNCIVTNCSFDVGDDAICIKSGKDEDGRNRGMPTENLIITSCVVYHGHGGVTVGSEMSGGVKNMHVSGCTFIGTDVGLRFKSNRGRGGVVENIYISDIDMLNIATNAISFNLYYGGLSVSEMMENKDNMDFKGVKEEKVSEETPEFKDISIKNVTCKGALQAVYLQGLPEMNLENMYLENINIEAENGFFCMDVDNITIKNMQLHTSKSPAVIFYNSKNVALEKLDVKDSSEPIIVVDGEKTDHIKLETGAQDDNFVKIGKKVTAGSVKINN